jgi:methionyl-tRNA formyltransferase
MRVVFFGSPDFAVASLESLLASKHSVVGVITQPDRPAGRGLQLQASAVKIVAQKNSLPIFQPEKVNCEQTYTWLKSQSPDVLVVVAYGEFLGKTLLQFCAQPPINVHPSLLPDLRGAAPMQWSLLRGYQNSGVTTQYMAKEMDAGDVLLQERCTIEPDENFQQLQDRLKIIGGRLLVKTLDLLEEKKLLPSPQDPTKVTFAPLLTKELGQIQWSTFSAQHIHNQVRGLFPWPSAFTFFQSKRCKILRSRIPRPEDCPQRQADAGEFFAFGDALFVKTIDSWLEILSIQPEGKRSLLPREFCNGIGGSHVAMRFTDSGEP